MKIGSEVYSFCQKEDKDNFVKYTMVHYNNEKTWKHSKRIIKDGSTIKEEVFEGFYEIIDDIRTNFTKNNYYLGFDQKKKETLFATSTQYCTLTPKDISISFLIEENLKLRNYQIE